MWSLLLELTLVEDTEAEKDNFSFDIVSVSVEVSPVEGPINPM